MARALLVSLLALLAGCVAPAPNVSDGGPSAPAASLGRPLFESESCDEGGGYVVWNPNGRHDERAGALPPPFTYSDATEDLGSPPVTAFGEPSGKPLAGAYHGVIACPTWALEGVGKTNLLLAFVSARVVAPSFDPSPLAREYLVGLVAVNDPDLEAALAARGIRPERLLSASLSFDGGLLRATMQFDHHGDIVSLVPIKTAGDRGKETMRLWFLAPVDGGARPVALDLEDTGGTRLIAPAPGHFDHRMPSATPPLPGAPLHELSSWALGYRGVARTIAPGPVVDTVLAADAGHGVWRMQSQTP